MEKFTVRQNSAGIFAITTFYSIVMTGLSITVNLKGWYVIFDLMACLMVFNIASCIYCFVVNRFFIYFYVWSFFISVALMFFSFYTWIVLTYWDDSNAFLVCLLFVSLWLAWLVYVYVKYKLYPDKQDQNKSGKNLAAAGAIAGAGFQVSSENGLLLIFSTTGSLIFSLLAFANLILLFKRQWILDGGK